MAHHLGRYVCGPLPNASLPGCLLAKIEAWRNVRNADSTLADGPLTFDRRYLGKGFLTAGDRTIFITRWAIDDITIAIFYHLYCARLCDGPEFAMQQAQTSLKFMSGTEFGLGYAKEIKQHLRKYSRALQEHRRYLEAQYEQDRLQIVQIASSDAKVGELLGTLGKAGIIDRLCKEERPFANSYYWEGFTW